MPQNQPSKFPEQETPSQGEFLAMISWRHLLVACALGLLSLIDQWQVTESLKVSGGATLVALAAVVLLWPVLRQITVRGGEIDLKGLRVKVNQIENEAQRIENDNALRIEELESKLDEIRVNRDLPPDRAVQPEASTNQPGLAEDSNVLDWAVRSYKEAYDIEDFRKRVEVDKEIIRKARRLSLATLQDFLNSQSWSAEAMMAVAVALGPAPRKEEELDRARLLARLMESGAERARARAGQSAKRWGEERSTSRESRALLLNATRQRLDKESASSGALGYLKKAYEVLSATQDWQSDRHSDR